MIGTLRLVSNLAPEAGSVSLAYFDASTGLETIDFDGSGFWMVALEHDDWV